ncbi:MAG: adenylosuccinate synthase [Candidatus Zixiibacteriota bacterium]|nr:MAG: adenylosuccinate synthase [candidate division Zixibacteria bacterium]
MPVIAVVGAQWGDEGKGKIVDLLAARAQVVARSQGGANAGHTIKRGGSRIILHLLPSGALSPDAQCLIGPGVVLDAGALLQELKELADLGISLKGRLTIDLRTHLVFPTHKLLEAQQETQLGNQKIGTTCRGIGPAYSDKAARRGVRLGDLLDKSRRLATCTALFDYHAALLEKIYHQPPLDRAPLLAEAEFWAEELASYAGDSVRKLREAVDRDQVVLLEGAQGTFLDLDLGTYPFVTSSHPTSGGPVVGIGLPPGKIDFVLGVLKAYCTRVGSGPFPTEMDDETAKLLRDRGAEYGATTGRPRRIGWLDLVAAKEAAQWNGVNGWALTKLDVLEKLPTLKVCSSYRIGDTILSGVPLTIQGWADAVPLYEELPGWEDGHEARDIDDLPDNARNYLAKIESYTGVPVHLISLGAGQEETILPRGELVQP